MTQRPEHDQPTSPRNPAREDAPDDGTVADSTGGGMATEEDIGTEGAGTEPRRAPDTDVDGGRRSPAGRPDERAS